MGLSIPHISLHASGKLISPEVNALLDEKIKKARKVKLSSAPYSEIVGVLTDLELITTDLNCGGYFHKEKKVIALKEYDFDPSQYLAEHKITKLCVPFVEEQKKVLCHEIGHALQAEVEKFEKHDCIMSWMLKLEWEAESISYKLYNSVFGKLPDYWFNAYFNKADIDYLQSWHSGWLENDLTTK